MRTKLVLVGIFLLSYPADASDFSIVGGTAAGSANLQVGTTAVGSGMGSFRYGGGVLYGAKMFPKAELELGLLYMPRGYVDTSGSAPVEYSFTTIQVPAIIRFWLNSSISFGVGGFFSHGLFTYSAGTSQVEYNMHTMRADDYGLAGSISLKFALLPILSVIIDGRYLYGLANLNGESGSFTNLRDIQVFTGFRFGN